MDTFYREYLGIPFDSGEELELRKIVEEYERRTEEFDRTVCTGPIKNGRIMPATGEEFSVVNRHAMQVRSELIPRVLSIGKTPAEFQQVLIGYRKERR